MSLGMGGSVGTTLESNLYGLSPFSLNGIDFAGYTIDSYKVTIDAINIDSFDNSVSVSSSLQINGERASNVVPEPATALMFGGGLMGAFVRRKKHA